MIKAIVIDDEQKTRESLVYLLNKYCPEIEVCATADTFQLGYELVKEQQPALIFMDIQLNSEDGTGIDLINTLSLHNCAVIFISGFKDYAVDAFRLKAVDYLLKPVRINFLMEAVEKAKKHLETGSLKPGTPGEAGQGNFHVPTQHGIMIIKHKDIIRCEADGAYTHFYTREKNERITSSVNIGQVEQKLDSGFLRVHKSHVVNKEFVTGYSRTDGLVVTMCDGSEVPVSKAHKDVFFKWIG